MNEKNKVKEIWCETTLSSHMYLYLSCTKKNFFSIMPIAHSVLLYRIVFTFFPVVTLLGKSGKGQVKNASLLSTSFLTDHLVWELRPTRTYVHWTFACCSHSSPSGSYNQVVISIWEPMTQGFTNWHDST